ncbi:MAG: hypothetical protein IRY99_24305 [Isosphaeraceae bacterium]|nr:hypothetical protein [Isosphaeraceae bacterium]
MAPEQRLTMAERANLVAYLDGELSEDEARAIATKLTQSPTARREVEVLEKTWELLDYLPRPEASPELMTRTLTQVALQAARGDQLAAVAGQAARRLLQAAVCLLTALGCLGVGYAATRWLWPDPTARLVRDLPLAEHLEEYREVGSFEFLQLLDNDPNFQKDTD